MPTITTGTGLISGIDIAALTDAMITAESGKIKVLEDRAAGFTATQTALKTVEANLLSLSLAGQSLGESSTFEDMRIANSDVAQVRVTAGSDVTPGSFEFQALRLSSTQQLRSKGFANADQQAIGAGTLTITTDDSLNPPTLVDSLNGGNGIRRGVIRITDRAGASANVDLSDAYSVDEILSAINDTAEIGVIASAEAGRLIVTDVSGGTGNLSVSEVNNGHAAGDLGLAQSTNSSRLVGDDVYYLTEDFTLEQIDDGNQLYRLAGAPDLRITLTDDSTLEVNLDSAFTLRDIVNLINDHQDNAGRVSAAVSNGRLILNDLSGGGGTSSFGVEDINGTSVVRQLGLDATASGTVLTGNRLSAGLNSVLLRNLRGGQGIDQLGSITLTDRTGTTAAVDLSSAESLDEVLTAINSATSGGGTALQLTARLNDAGNGIQVVDTSGSIASNLVIADVGGGTVAAQLGIAVDAAQDSIDSGSLNLRRINEATSIADYAPDGGSIDVGEISITDSAGNHQNISISSAVKTVGDVLVRINAAADVAVRAELNETGDGFVLIDEAGGAGVLKVEEVNGTTAADLRILGEGTLNAAGKQQISSRQSTIVDIAATDTLNDIVQKINDASPEVKASVFNDGSAFNATRLLLTSTSTGASGQFHLDTSGLDLGLSMITAGQDARMRVGSNVEPGFVITSDDDLFEDIATGVDVELLNVGDQAASVEITRSGKPIRNALSDFVTNYNKFIDVIEEATQFDMEANTRGVLQGSNTVLRVTSRLDALANGKYVDSNNPFRSLADLGVRFTKGGRLKLDDNVLEKAITTDFDAVRDFFLDTENGFAQNVTATTDSLTDPFTGTLAIESNSLQESVDSINKRVEDMNTLLEARRERLQLQFVQMESILSELNAQQDALTALKQFQTTNMSQGSSK